MTIYLQSLSQLEVVFDGRTVLPKTIITILVTYFCD